MAFIYLKGLIPAFLYGELQAGCVNDKRIRAFLRVFPAFTAATPNTPRRGVGKDKFFPNDNALFLFFFHEY